MREIKRIVELLQLVERHRDAVIQDIKNQNCVGPQTAADVIDAMIEADEFITFPISEIERKTISYIITLAGSMDGLWVLEGLGQRQNTMSILSISQCLKFALSDLYKLLNSRPS